MSGGTQRRGEGIAAGPAEHEDAQRDHGGQEARGLQHARASPVHGAGSAPENHDRPDDQGAHRVAEPPREPDGAVVDPVRVAGQRQAGHSDRRAHGRGEEPRQHDELEDVARPVEARRGRSRTASHEIRAQAPLERVAHSDADRGRDGARGGDVHEEGADQDGGPGARSQQQERREGDAARRPHRRGAGVEERQAEAELARDESSRSPAGSATRSRAASEILSWSTRYHARSSGPSGPGRSHLLTIPAYTRSKSPRLV